MTKAQLFSMLADKTGMSKKNAKAAVEAFVDVVTSALKKRDSVTITGFGKFGTRHVEAREGVTPSKSGSGKKYSVKAHYAPTFKAGKQLKEAVK